MSKWRKAISEVKLLKTKSIQERLKFFEQLDNNHLLQKQAKRVEKRKREQSNIANGTDMMPPPDEMESPPAKKKRKTNVDETENAKSVAADTIPPYVPILDNENILPSRTRSGLYSDGGSDIVSKISSDKSDVSDPFSIEAQRSLFKRNNLFRGVSKEKVCQYCFKADMVFKCTKGGCKGLYHINCSMDILNEEKYNKKKLRSKCFLL